MGSVVVVIYLVVGALVMAFMMRARWVIDNAPVPEGWTEKQRERLSKCRSDGGWSGTLINTTVVVFGAICTALVWPMAVLMLSGGHDQEKSPWLKRGRFYLVRTGRLPE